jgi:DNA-binding response OmpR family regulator
MIYRSPVILCVEDDLDTQDMLRILLNERGYEFEAASTCADALRLMREKKIALLALDNSLPDGTGVELCKRVREFDKNLPIIFVSGSAYDEERQEALKSGANAFLTKPLAFNEFFALLGNYAPV